MWDGSGWDLARRPVGEGLPQVAQDRSFQDSMFGIDAEMDGYHGISACNALAMLHMLALLLSRYRLARRRVASGRSAGVPRPSLFRSRAPATRGMSGTTMTVQRR